MTKEELYEELCARLRFIARYYKDVKLEECFIIGGDEELTDNGYISNVRYIYCPTLADFKLANTTNYKACRDFEEGVKND